MNVLLVMPLRCDEEEPCKNARPPTASAYLDVHAREADSGRARHAVGDSSCDVAWRMERRRGKETETRMHNVQRRSVQDRWVVL